MKKLLLFLMPMVAASLPASAATILFDLVGKAGSGLISGNQNGSILGTPGSGGEVGAGIFYDDVANVLTINVAWGLTNGFTNLTGTATLGHIHGPTIASGTASFTQDASVLFDLDNTAAWNPSATAGGITNRTITLSASQETELLAGRYYINVHTGTNGAGEIRGNLVVVPEPSAGLLGLAGGALALRRRRR
jgi:hypothetical protein